MICVDNHNRDLALRAMTRFLELFQAQQERGYH